MKSNEYLTKKVEKISLSDDCTEIINLQSEKEKVETLLKDNFDKNHVSIQYAGSYKKGTMIKDNYDLDIICYFEHDYEDAGSTLKDIYDNVKKALNAKYRIESKKSALRLLGEKIDFHIDVVPGRFVDDKKDDAFIYQESSEKNRLKTNLKKHVSLIKGSGLTDTIKLAKFWVYQNQIDIKTFILELLVVKILNNLNDVDDGLDACLLNFWAELSSNIDDISIEDPSNPQGNDLSKLFNETIKDSLSKASSKALKFIKEIGWINYLGPINELDNSAKYPYIEIVSKENSDIPKPWFNE